MYKEAYHHILQLVKPERLKNNDVRARKLWWQYKRPTLELYDAIAEFDQVIALAQVSKTVMPALVPQGQVFDQKLIVFTSNDPAMLSLLSSAIHYWWAIARSATMKADLSYSPTDVIQTLVLPKLIPEMRELGGRLDSYRRELMLARQAGLTKTYNMVHDRSCQDEDIAELREIHKLIDDAVIRAYGWADLLTQGLDHGFHKTRQGPRYTLGPVVRQEILDRLLELNHERYAEEVAAGLHGKKATHVQGDLFS